MRSSDDHEALNNVIADTMADREAWLDQQHATSGARGLCVANGNHTQTRAPPLGEDTYGDANDVDL